MSYCRWSTILPDNYESDLYVYDHVGGYIAVHVAGSRTAGIENAPRRRHSPELRVEDYVARARWRNENADKLVQVRIDLPYAGTDRGFADPSECVVFLRELRALGYRMPDHVLEIDTYGRGDV